MDKFGKIDSKFRFIILASKRAKQLLKGAKPKIKGKSKSLIRIAQAEVRAGLIEYEIIPARMDDAPEREERVFVGAGIPDETGEADGHAAKDPAEGETELGEEPVEGGEVDEEGEEREDGLKEDKEE